MHINREILARSAPFVFYIAVMMLTDFITNMGVDARWMYGLRVLGTLFILRYFWNSYSELKLNIKLPIKTLVLSIGLGLLVFLLWINLNQNWMMLGTPKGYDPRDASGDLNYAMILLRICGAFLIVPIMEELFWRSFLMRWIDAPDFTRYAPIATSIKALIIASILFASEHTFWFAGFIAGIIYGLLYIKMQNLWLPIISHSVTNLTLGVWVIYTQQWQYW